MQRLAIVCGFSAMLFLAGLLAGRAVFAVSDGTEEFSGPSNEPGRISKHSSDSFPNRNMSRMPFMTVSNEILTQDDAASSSPNHAGFEDMAGASETQLPKSSDSHRHDDVLALIDSIFPNADPETAEVWAGVYADTDLAEVAFILEQKRRLSGTLTAASFASLSENWLLPPACPEPFVDSATPAAAAICAVRNNLRGAWSIGFRRTVVLPEVVTQPELTSGEQRQLNRSTMFLCFDAGRIISSPTATHVALPASDGSLMFLLEGNRLTRRGDFELLPDRRLGLITQTATYVIEDSPVIPEAAIAIRITVSGEICYDDESGKSVVAGQLNVLRIIDLTKIRTGDGVIFTRDTAESGSSFTPVSAELTTNALEISNVDGDEERDLLEHLISLSR